MRIDGIANSNGKDEEQSARRGEETEDGGGRKASRRLGVVYRGHRLGFQMMGRLLEAQKVTRRLSPLPNGPFVAKTPRRNLRGR